MYMYMYRERRALCSHPAGAPSKGVGNHVSTHTLTHTYI